jgi:hypothetical protein
VDADAMTDEHGSGGTAKSCGPEAPMAGRKSARGKRLLQATVTIQPGLAEESTK